MKKDLNEMPNFGSTIPTHPEYEGNEKAFEQVADVLKERKSYILENKKGKRRETFVSVLDAPGAGISQISGFCHTFPSL